MLQGFVRKLNTATRALRDRDASEVMRLAKQNWRLIAGRVTGVEVDGCRYKIAGFPAEMWRSLVTGEYERQERQAIRKYLDPSLPLIEMGGCLGVVSCIANRALNHPRKHIVVEASPAFSSIIRSNATRNSSDFAIVTAAIAYGCDRITFWENPKYPYSSALDPIHEGAVEISVPTTTLKNLVQQYGLTRCSLVCDIEGQEYQMIQNELPLIAGLVSWLILETHPRLIGQEKTDEMLSQLSGAGFVTIDILDDVYIFTHP